MKSIMETQLVTDINGALEAVKIDYQDWLKIAAQLGLPVEPTSKVTERNPLDWYSRTESANSILNSLVALGSRESRNELKKAKPDLNRVAELKALQNEAFAALNDNDNFTTLDRLDAVIDNYSPILLAEKKKSQFKYSFIGRSYRLIKASLHYPQTRV
jgi:hypothetical protein